MKKFLLSLFLLSLLFLPSPIFAQEETTNPSLLPGSRFYFLKDWSERISLFFTFDEEEKIEKRLLFAQERLDEIEALGENVDEETIEKLKARYEEHMIKAEEIAKRREEKKAERIQRIQEARERHILRMEEVIENAPEEAQPGLNRAMEEALKSYEKLPVEMEGDGVPASREVFQERFKEIKERVSERRGVDRDEE